MKHMVRRRRAVPVEAFPFTDAEWDALKPVVESILNASLAEDEALAASLRVELLGQVDHLREQYGDHPVLLETAADYTDDGAERVTLYRRAAAIAQEHGLPTLSIRTALAFALMNLGEPAAALEELQTCGGEAASASGQERAEWAEKLQWAAEYTADDAERSVVYRRAVEIAAAHGQPTLYIRLCLVRHLLDAGQPAAALAELRTCRGEVPAAGEDDRTWWAGLLEEASGAEPGVVPARDKHDR